MKRLAVFLIVVHAGCQMAPQPAPAPVGKPVPKADEPVIRGQGPAAFESAPWGPSYLAPGELSCETPPPVGLGYQMSGPPLIVPPQYALPGTAAATAPQSSEAGWLDVLPPEGGPISDDFGLPTQPKIEGRVPNPLFVRATNPDAAWEEIARETSRYFPIRTEERVTQQGSMLTEGRIETRWGAGSTIFEPWRRDSVGSFNRWQSTLQTIRRRTIVRVIPAAGGYEIDMRVDKQLEDLNRPERASAGGASIRNDSALPTDRVTPVDAIRESGRWIDIGRDEALEQRMLKRLAARFAAGQ